jgi:hypothetical protein
LLDNHQRKRPGRPRSGFESYCYKSFDKGYGFADTLNFMRKMVEFKNLLTQLQPSFTPLPASGVGSPNFAYQQGSASISEHMYHTNYPSEMFQKPFPTNSWITVGLKGRVCPKCLLEFCIPIFLKIEGKNDIFEPQHECVQAGLYSVKETEEALKTKNMNLTKQMPKIIKLWLVWENCIIAAKEMNEYHPVIGEIKTNQKHHWSARAIKDNFTELKDDNELTDFLAKTNNSTFGLFKINTSQQSSPRFYLFMIIKKEWLNH